jgi:hypothetical protein
MSCSSSDGNCFCVNGPGAIDCAGICDGPGPFTQKQFPSLEEQLIPKSTQGGSGASRPAHGSSGQ